MDEMCKTKLHEDFEDVLLGRAREAGQGWVVGEWNRKLEQY